jgi:hypothetical protein
MVVTTRAGALTHAHTHTHTHTQKRARRYQFYAGVARRLVFVDAVRFMI